MESPIAAKDQVVVMQNRPHYALVRAVLEKRSCFLAEKSMSGTRSMNQENSSTPETDA